MNFWEVGIEIPAGATSEIKMYISAKPCKKCGTSLRYKSNYGCAECLRQSNREYYARNQESRKFKNRAWFKMNPEWNRAQSARWTREHPDKAKVIRKNARLKRPEHYRAKGRFYRSIRRTILMRATPSWIDRIAIESIYRACPKGYEVDHIVPLKGVNVCGLHVPWNLQYLTKQENGSKGNRHG